MANTVFENKVIEAKATDLLLTKVNARTLMTIDNSLAETEGQTKTINRYLYNGHVEVLEDGQKNSYRGTVGFSGYDYKVKRVQQVFDYTDSDYQKDNSVVDIALEGANQLMANKMTEDFYAELAKSQNVYTWGEGKFRYDVVVDVIAEMGVEDESKLILAIPTAWKADIRKDEDFKSARMGEILFNGQIGSIAGIPVIATNALDGTAYLFTTEAVRLIMKKDVEVEQDRDIETKTNTVVLSSYYICALVDESKVFQIGA